MIELLNRIDGNVFCSILLFLLFVNLKDHHLESSFMKRIFRLLVLSVIAMLLLEDFAWLLDGKEGVGYMISSTLLNAVFLAANPVPVFLWVLYSITQSAKENSIKNSTVFLISIPLIFNVFISLISISTGWVFYINSENFYVRGPFFYTIMIITFGYLFYGIFDLSVNRKNMERKKFIYLLSFSLFPLIGGLLQSMLYGVSVLWNCVSVSVFMLYLSIQSKEMNQDYLTETRSRRNLDDYLSGKIKNYDYDNPFSVIMIDIDDFKRINDVHGHKAGDMALVDFSKILKKSTRTSDFIARYGGDEFVIVLDVGEENEIRRVIERMENNIDEYNRSSGMNFKLGFSYGYSVYDDRKKLDADHFVDYVDSLMYKNKNRKKSSNI